MYGKILIAAAGLSVWIVAFADSNQGVPYDSAGNATSTGLMDFTSPSAPTFVPPGTTVLSPAQPDLMGADISLSPTLLDNGTGGPAPAAPRPAAASPKAAASANAPAESGMVPQSE